MLSFNEPHSLVLKATMQTFLQLKIYICKYRGALVECLDECGHIQMYPGTGYLVNDANNHAYSRMFLEVDVQILDLDMYTPWWIYDQKVQHAHTMKSSDPSVHLLSFLSFHTILTICHRDQKEPIIWLGLIYCFNVSYIPAHILIAYCSCLMNNEKNEFS